MPKEPQDSDDIEFVFLRFDQSPPESDGALIVVENANFGARIQVSRGSEKVLDTKIRGPIGHQNRTLALEAAKVRAKEFGAKVVYMKGFPDA